MKIKCIDVDTETHSYFPGCIPVKYDDKATVEFSKLSDEDRKKLWDLFQFNKDVEIKEKSKDVGIKGFNYHFRFEKPESKKLKGKNMNLEIRNIYYDDTPGKEVVVVIFTDGTKILKHLSKGDTFDLRTAVAFAIAEKLFGSKTQFKKFVENKAVKNIKAEKKVK